MTYRRDIDGLRAVAIIPVVLMHAGVPHFDGGFVGVDVFFVISGYLITSLLLRDLDKNRFSIIEFYERRFRRIFPALAVVLAFSIVVGHILLFPRDYRDFGASTIATLSFASNILFNLERGYFSPSADRAPLLHTWSLGVEEQFYIVLPVVLFLITRYFRKRYLIALSLILSASFAFSVWQVRQSPQAAFYLLPSRTWELLIGAMLATSFLPACKERMARLLGCAGLLLIAWSVFSFHERIVFPGPNALFPCLGAALIIYSGEANTTIVSRLLSNRAMAFTGSISYSLYLWHWVLIVFAKYYLARSFTRVEVVAAVVGSFAAAWASWRFVESPFRKRKDGVSRKGLFVTVGATTATMIVLGAVVFLSRGLPNRFSERVNDMVDAHQAPLACRDVVCSVGVPGGSETFLVWGDSHVLALGGLIDTVALERGLSGILVGRITCPPFMGLRRFDRPADYCVNLGAQVVELIKTRSIKNVVLHARWAAHSEDMRFGQETGLGSELAVRPNTGDNFPAFESMLHATLSEFKKLGVAVFIVGSVPEAKFEVGFVHARSQLSGINRAITIPFREFKQRHERAFLAFERETEAVSGDTLYPHEFLCDQESCHFTDGESALYNDYHHLNKHGVKRLRPLMEALFDHAEFIKTRG